jgi:cation diffusion facilitator family transporter
MSSGSSRFVVWAALAGNVLVALTKFGAAAFTGSSAMLSEGVHSLVDSGNEVVMLYGMRRAARPPDERHPLGHGRELYFWSFIVAILIFAVGAGVSLFEGIMHVRRPEPVSSFVVNYVVIGLALLFESGSWWVAVKAFRRAKGADVGYVTAVRRSKDPPIFMVLVEDTAALLGLVIALAGTAAADVWDAPVFDGAASIGIGLLLGVVALFLARESKGLLIGEPARPEIVRSIESIARAEKGVDHAAVLLTAHLGPREIIAAVSVDFADGQSAATVETLAASLDAKIRRAHPDVSTVLIVPQSLATFRRTLQQERRLAEG